MAKDFYLITLKMQKPLRCKVLAKTTHPQPEKNRYLIELDNPIPQSFYGWDATDESEKPFSKLRFQPHGGNQPWTKTGPFRGTACSFLDETNATLDSSAGGLERAILCTSEKQAQEYMRLLEESKKGPYLLDVCGRKLPTRDCRIVKDVILGGWKGYWLAEVNPPFPAKAFKMEKEFSRVLLALNDLPVPGQPILFALCFVDQDIAIGKSVTPQEIGLNEVDEGTLWRPQDRESFYSRTSGPIV